MAMGNACATATAARFFPSRGDVVVLLAEVRTGAAGVLSAFDERAAEPRTPLARAAGRALAGTLVVAWAKAGPGRQLSGTREAAHVGAHLGDHDLRGPLTDARDRPQMGYRSCGTA